MRLIDADALIKRLRKARLIFDKNEARFESLGIGYAIEIIEQETPTISQWIPCSEKLPSKSDYYLVTDKDYKVTWVCRYMSIQGVGGWTNHVSNPPVFAWMSLPQPYKEK